MARLLYFPDPRLPEKPLAVYFFDIPVAIEQLTDHFIVDKVLGSEFHTDPVLGVFVGLDLDNARVQKWLASFGPLLEAVAFDEVIREKCEGLLQLTNFKVVVEGLDRFQWAFVGFELDLLDILQGVFGAGHLLPFLTDT